MGNRIMTTGAALMTVAGFGAELIPNAAWGHFFLIISGAAMLGWQIGAIADDLAHRN